MSETNWVEGFWAILDIVSASTAVASLHPLDPTQDVHIQKGRSYEEASAQFLNRISILSQSPLDFPSAGNILEYARTSLSCLPKPSEISV
jgi:hypothetical protein